MAAKTRTLVAYFSASGVTKHAAREVANAAGGDLFEIVPEQPYTAADLNWRDKASRSTVENNERSIRPVIASAVDDMGAYDTVFVGFPIWWYREPNIIDTFLEAYDFAGKTVVPFCTSGGSNVGKIDQYVAELVPGAVLKPAKLLNGMGPARIEAWVDGLAR